MIGRAALLLAMLAPLAGGCAIRPLYAGGGDGPVVRSLANVEVAPIAGRAGWLVRDALLGQLAGGPAAQYRLEVELDDRISRFGVREDEAATRERRTLRARYRLVDLASGEAVLTSTAGSDAGVDIASSEYATIAAEDTALENLSVEIARQIVTRLSMHARQPG
jgi:LPS-assembly lipoprotein